MRSFTDAELATVHRFPDIIIDVAAAPITQPGGARGRSQRSRVSVCAL
jgi:hypothetical protein